MNVRFYQYKQVYFLENFQYFQTANVYCESSRERDKVVWIPTFFDYTSF